MAPRSTDQHHPAFAAGDIGRPRSLIELRGISRDYPSGSGTVSVLRGIDLTIEAGEMVAIVGASGSGKSTLMNILGCLDRPTAGSYHIAGQDTGTLDPDALARLRREHFGFVFQRYNLLGDITAIANVEMPAVYTGLAAASRHERAATLLGQLGMGERLNHRPGQLSGGQQQRVSIARALMNDGEIVFADEPTGALDSRSGRDVMDILRRLHADGRTIVLVTHDMQVAGHADRMIEIADGAIVADRIVCRRAAPIRQAPARAAGRSRGALFADRFREALRMALSAMNANRLRTMLTMLGIVIGIASVVSVVAIGEGSRRKVLASISDLGTSTIEIWSGHGWGDTEASQKSAFQPEDSDALARQYYVAGSSPTLEQSIQARHGGTVANVDLTGVSEQYFTVKNIPIQRGGGFDRADVARRAQRVVIDQNALRTFFRDGGDPVGQTILLGTQPMQIAGVAADAPTIRSSRNPIIFVPYSTLQSRIVGRTPIRSLVVRIRDGISSGAAEQAVTHLLSMRRGTDDFYIENSDAIRKTTEATAHTMTVLISVVAVISLVVGGIGVMNIMLVSVTERTGEIGIRMAVGARRLDIMSQFLVEAVLICLVGGLLGVGVALIADFAFEAAGSPFDMILSGTSILFAVLFSSLVGIAFGWLPARNAARLDPVRALARE